MSKWILNSQENNGILVVTTLPSGNWMESLTDTDTYLVIFSDDRRIGPTNQSYFGKVVCLFIYLSIYISICTENYII